MTRDYPLGGSVMAFIRERRPWLGGSDVRTLVPDILRLGRAAIYTAICERAPAQSELDRIGAGGGMPVGLELEYLRHACGLHYLFGDWARMGPLRERLLALSRQSGFSQGVAYGLYYAGLEIINSGDYQGAIATFQRALDVEKDLTDSALLGEIHNDIGFCCRRAGDAASAEENYRRSLAVRERSGDLQGQAESLSNLGFLKVFQGELDQAEALLNNSLSLEMQIGDKISAGYTLVNLGYLAFRRGQFARSRQFHQRALDLRRALDDHLGQGHCYLQLRALADVEDDGPEELRLYNAAYHSFVRAGDATGQLETKLSIAEYWLNNDRPEACARILDRQAVMAASVADARGRLRYQQLRLRSAVAAGDREEVLRLRDSCGGGADLHQDHVEIEAAVSVAVFLGEPERAIALRQRMLDIAVRQGDVLLSAKFRYLLGRQQGSAGRPLVERALAEFRAMGAVRLARRAERYLQEQAE